MALWLCRAHFVPSIGSIGLFILAVSGALFITGFLSVLYLAIEPFVRRHWPHAIISWARLLTGKIRDPLVGRDVMIGIFLGVAWALALELTLMLKQRLGGPPTFGSPDFMMGARSILGIWLWHMATSIMAMLGFFFTFFLFRVILRNPWLAAFAFVAFWSGLKLLNSHHLAIDVTTQIFIYGLAAIIVVRYGFLSLAIGILVADLLLNVPISTHVSSWHFGATLFVFVLVVALAAYGFYVALAGQKLWKENLLD